MRLRTEINIEPLDWQVDYHQKGLSVGSCFAENIAQHLQRVRFPVVSNPFGVMYNPVSVADTIDRLAQKIDFTKDDLLSRDGVWSCFSAHGSFSDVNPDVVVERLNQRLEQGSKALQEADYVLLTFGSAWVYELTDDVSLTTADWSITGDKMVGRVVANCHKLPSRAFTRRRMTVSEIVQRYERLFEETLRDKNILLTISPVRHIKDGLAENNLSKAILRLAIEELVVKQSRVSYFPSFEIVNDDLRDYRFYKSDLVHPSKMAVDYIWTLFCDSTMHPTTRATMNEVEALVVAGEHRAINSESEAHREFLRGMTKRVDRLMAMNPELDLDDLQKSFQEGRQHKCP